MWIVPTMTKTRSLSGRGHHESHILGFSPILGGMESQIGWISFYWYSLYLCCGIS